MNDVARSAGEARLRVAQPDELDPDTFAAINELCEAAFEESFAASWESIGPGTHVYLEDAGRILAHAIIVDRPLYLGHEPDISLDAGYVEAVATLPALQGRGHATRVMEHVGSLILDEYAIGVLSTGSNAFYERLGWETWRGPLYVQMTDGQRVRAADEDGGAMILRTSRTPPDLDLEGPAAVDWRPEESW